MAAMATTTARFPHHYALKYRTSSPLATVVAVAIAANSGTTTLTKLLKGKHIFPS